jgi:tubby-related protein 1
MPGGVKALSKKSGNYVGKLRSKTLQGNEYVLVNNAPVKGELAAFVYEQLDIMAQVREGPLPRRVVVTVPPIGDDGEPIPQEAKGPKGALIPMCIPKTRDERARDMCIFQTKDPSYENGCYRLNFNGRVKVPSVKNFQLVSAADPEDVVFQFGKFDDEKFTVDFKAPFTAFQAFALALSQFDF